jgi:hypothetical protein
MSDAVSKQEERHDPIAAAEPPEPEQEAEAETEEERRARLLRIDDEAAAVQRPPADS